MPKILSKKLQQELINVFRNNRNIICVYLFGSYIKGNLTNNSDIDFAILSKNNINKAELIYKIEEVLNFKIPVQLIELNNQDLIFQHNVIREGKILYEGDKNTRVRFEVSIMKEFNELEPKLKFLEKRIIKSIIKNL